MGSDIYIKAAIISIIIVFAMCAFIVLIVNSCSRQDWNNGTCPVCEVRYELRGISEGLKCYSCPNCGKEVERY